MRKFYGKYRGKVEGNVDPLMLGRVQVSCPPVLGDGKLAWAMPAVPFAGPQVGFFVVPPQNANVWVEFEQGDPDSPIWAGCFWGTGEVPASPAVASACPMLVFTEPSAHGAVRSTAPNTCCNAWTSMGSPRAVAVEATSSQMPTAASRSNAANRQARSINHAARA